MQAKVAHRSAKLVGGPLAVSSSDFAARFQQIYGKPLDHAEREWRTFCASFR
jgi:hypothetical protein